MRIRSNHWINRQRDMVNGVQSCELDLTVPSWEHRIELVREIDNHQEESPYLLEAIGQAPPEDVGGVPGFVDFHTITLDPKHPEYEHMKKWAGYWSLELSVWETKPRVIPV